MTEAPTAAEFLSKLQTEQSDTELEKYQRYFKFKIGEQDMDDYFIGVKMGTVFKLAKDAIDMTPEEIEVLLASPIHEARVGAVSIMDWQVRRKKTSAARRKALYDLYLRRHDRINNWDIVDRAAPWVIGSYLIDQPRTILQQLAESANPWERRTAIVSTGYFIKQGQLDDTFFIAEILLEDSHELVQKATGWMLRAAGTVDEPRLIDFLNQHADQISKPLMREAIQKLTVDQKSHFRELIKNR